MAFAEFAFGALILLGLLAVVVLPVYALVRLRRSSAELNALPDDLRRSDESGPRGPRDPSLGEMWPMN